jgi:hypothetical protein
MKAPLSLAVVLFASMSFAAPATAQQPAPRDDVQWETRHVAWDGGPVRPGAELDAHVSRWVLTGTVALVVGYAGSFLGLDPRAGSIIPLVGPWLSVAGVFDEEPWEDEQTVFMVLSGVLQAGGLLAIILGALNPRYEIVYDAPVGSPPLTVSWAPGAEGADVGSSLRVDFF